MVVITGLRDGLLRWGLWVRSRGRLQLSCFRSALLFTPLLRGVHSLNEGATGGFSGPEITAAVELRLLEGIREKFCYLLFLLCALCLRDPKVYIVFTIGKFAWIQNQIWLTPLCSLWSFRMCYAVLKLAKFLKCFCYQNEYLWRYLFSVKCTWSIAVHFQIHKETVNHINHPSDTFSLVSSFQKL